MTKSSYNKIQQNKAEHNTNTTKQTNKFQSFFDRGLKFPKSLNH